jgi:hypothetical protein
VRQDLVFMLSEKFPEKGNKVDSQPEEQGVLEANLLEGA